MPQSDESWLSAPLAFLTRMVLRGPRSVLMLAALLAVASIALSAADMGFHTRRLDLLNPNSDYNRLWIDYLEEFGDGDDAVVVVRGAERENVLAALDELAEVITEEDRYFRSVLHEIDLSRVRAKGLHYLSVEELQQIERSLDEVDPVLNDDWPQVSLEHQLRAAAAGAGGAQSAAQTTVAAAHLERLSASLAASLATPEGEYVSPWPISRQRIGGLGATDASDLASHQGRMLTNEGRLGFILLRLRRDEENNFNPSGDAIRRLRDLIAQAQANHSRVEIGLTGLPVMEYDEMQTSGSDMLHASLISLLGVACLFMAGLGGVRHPLLTVGALLLALAWSLGYITLAVGHLNILSVAFGVILIGLGIDFGIHYVARYLQLRGENQDCASALTTTAATIGPGVTVGAITTAIAFFAAYFTQFTGIVELGVIAGGGILLCLAATLVVLPAMIYLADRRTALAAPPRPLRTDRWIEPLLRFPGATLFVGVLITGMLSAGIGRLYYDHNLLNLQPAGLQSVELERMLLDKTDLSVWYAISIASSNQELLKRKQQFDKLPSVERTEEIVSLLPTHVEEKAPIIARIHRRLEHLPDEPPIIPVASPEEIGRELSAAGVAISGNDPRGRATQRRLSEVGERLSRMSKRDVYQHVSEYQQRIAADLLSQLHALESISQPQPPTLADLPESLVSRFVGRNQQHLLKIYGRGDIWDMDGLEHFVADVKTVDPAATGQPLQTYYASHQMQRSYVNAALYALAAVAVVLVLDFRSIPLALLALSPVAAGVIQMFGVMGLLGIPLNPANMIVLPLILGIGLDDGVHVVHDFRRRRKNYRLSASTATAVLITSLTTMVGFGSLMLASHRGLQSLGRVLTIGVTCCLISSLVLLPALLRWIGNGEAAAEDQVGPAARADAETAPGSNADIAPVDPIEPRRKAALKAA